jgi:hypothetical protein
MDLQNKRAIFNLLLIISDLRVNLNVEENLATLTGAIKNIDRQIEASGEIINSEAIINNCIYVKCILLQFKVLFLERNYSNLDGFEKQINDLLSD